MTSVEGAGGHSGVISYKLRWMKGCCCFAEQPLSDFWSQGPLCCPLPSCPAVSCLVSLQRRWRGEALCHLQHCSGLRLRRALQPVQLPEGAGAPLPADVPRAAQRLSQRQARLPCPRTDALALQIKREQWLSRKIFLQFLLDYEGILST